MEHDYFLATTALQEYWDKTKPLIFLTKACVSYKSEADAIILPDPWREKDALYRARAYTENQYQKVIFILSQVLNEIHGAHYSQRYWEILLGPFLRIYIAVLYDRYTCLRSAYATYHNLQTITLTKSSYAVAATPQEFSNFLLTDLFNLQIYSFLLDYFHAASKQKFTNVRAVLSQKTTFTLQHKFKNFVRRICNRFFYLTGDKSKILFIDSGVSVVTLIKLFFKSKGQIVPTHMQSKIEPQPIDWHMRQKILKLNLGGSDFEKCLMEGLTYFLPSSFLEDYQQYANQVMMLKPEVIFSSMGWHYNEPMKFFAAHAQEQGTLLAGHQHGGDYGILDFHTSEQHELAVTNKFYSWGWDQVDTNVNVKAFSSLKLRETKKRSTAGKKPHYLYGTANGRRYLLRFNYSISAITDYFQFQQKFLKTLPDYLQEKLLIRLYPSDWGWERNKRFQDANFSLKFQSPNIAFAKAIAEAQLYIADHISTTFAESIAINKPTLIVADPIMWSIRAEAKPYFDELKQVGVFYEDPILAANALIEIDKDIQLWWRSPERTKAINHFRQRFCRSATNQLDEWVKELLMVSREGRI